MGEALLGGMVESGWASPADVAVIELSETRRGELAASHPGVVVGDSLHDGVDALIAVKPQHVTEVVTELATLGVERILCVAAGVTIASMGAAGRHAGDSLYAEHPSARGRRSLGDRWRPHGNQ